MNKAGQAKYAIILQIQMLDIFISYLWFERWLHSSANIVAKIIVFLSSLQPGVNYHAFGTLLNMIIIEEISNFSL